MAYSVKPGNRSAPKISEFAMLKLLALAGGVVAVSTFTSRPAVAI
jgi:hypothetical protein